MYIFIRRSDNLQLQQVVNTYLQEINIDSPYEIWTRSSTSEAFKLVLQSHDKCKRIQLSEKCTYVYSDSPTLSSYEQPFQQFNQHDRVHIYFEYTDSFQLVLSILDSMILSEGDLKILYYLLYPFYSNFIVEDSKYKLHKVIESIRDASSSLNLDEVFQRILSNALNVFPNGVTGSLWMYDSDIDRIICKASTSNMSEGVQRMRFEIGEGPIGYTYEKEKAILISNAKDLKTYNFSRFSKINLQYWESQEEDLHTVKSILTCPIVIDHQIEGVMYFQQSTADNSLTKQHLNLLQVFSSQVGVAIKNAQQYKSLNNLNNILLRRDDIHASLTNLSLQSSGEKKVIQELARIIDKSIIFVDLIEDKHIPSKIKLPNNLTLRELYRMLLSKNKKSFYELRNNHKITHEIQPIQTDSILLGCLIIEVKEEPLDEIEHLALEQGNSVLTLELFKKLQLVEYYYKNTREAFNHLLNIRDEATIFKKATELGFEKDSSIAAVNFQFTNYTDSKLLNAEIHRLISQLKSMFPFIIQTVFGHQNQVTLIVRLNDGNEKKEFLKQLEEVVNLWSSNPSAQLSAGLGTVYDSITQVAKSYKEAKVALSYQISRGDKSVMEYAHLGINRLFIEQDTEVINQFTNEVFNPLNEFDHPDNVLTETLLTYYESNRSASETAKNLYIHVNTLYQRLKKIEDILNVSFKVPEDSLRLNIACYLKE